MFEHRIDRKRTVATFSNVYGKSCVGFCLNTGKRAQKFHFRSNRKRKVPLENSARDFQYIPLFQRSACFYVKITGHFDCFQYFNFETNFLKKENVFQLKVLRLKTQHFHTKVPCQKSKLKATSTTKLFFVIKVA